MEGEFIGYGVIYHINTTHVEPLGADAFTWFAVSCLTQDTPSLTVDIEKGFNIFVHTDIKYIIESGIIMTAWGVVLCLPDLGSSDY